MKVYKILHKPTGLFFTPSRGHGNLSRTGKIYPKPPRLEWAGDTIRVIIRLWGDKKPNIHQRKIIDYFGIESKTDGGYWIDGYFGGEKSNWEIIEIV
jgi:hypothetical protein